MPHESAIDAITISGLTKRFGSLTAVDDLTVDIPTGGVVGLLGPNGAGKSVTIRMLLGLIRPTSGSGTVLGHPITNPEAFLPRVGALIEAPTMYPKLSAERNLRSLARLAGVSDGRVAEVLHIVGLTGREQDPFGDYSLGMKQRLGIAAALLRDPELLILDEPTNGLDPAGIVEIRDLLVSLGRQGRTVAGCITFCHTNDMAKAISVRLDDETERALQTLESSGLTRSEAIRSSLLASAARLRRGRDLAAEAAALEADEADREEMLAVASLMESMRAPG